MHATHTQLYLGQTEFLNLKTFGRNPNQRRISVEPVFTNKKTGPPRLDFSIPILKRQFSSWVQIWEWAIRFHFRDYSESSFKNGMDNKCVTHCRSKFFRWVRPYKFGWRWSEGIDYCTVVAFEIIIENAVVVGRRDYFIWVYCHLLFVHNWILVPQLRL